MFVKMVTESLLLFFLFATPSPGEVDPGTPQNTAVETAQKKASDLPPALPRLRLAPVPGFDDEAAHLRSIAEQAAELVTAAERADQPTERVDRRLAAANLLLARQLEPLCSATFFRLVENATSVEDLHPMEVLDRTEKLLAQCESELAGLTEKKDLPTGWRDRAARRAQTLRNFASALRSYLIPASNANGEENAIKTNDANHVDNEAEPSPLLRRAASRLSPLLEDEDPALSTAASFWQASLRQKEGDPDRALAVLDLVLADPPKKAMPYAFFSRLLRCRLIADRGGFVAALALLMQLEEHCDEWLTSDVDRQNALRAVRLVQVQILQQWIDHLEGDAQTVEREWCVDRMESIIADSLSGESPTLLRLSPAIPIVSPPPDKSTPKPETAPKASEPAPTPKTP